MKKNKILYKNKYRVQSIRLKNWDYSNPGYYFITICTKNMENIFGEIVDGKIVLNELGYIVKHCWRDLPNHYKNCVLDSHILMPNHFHGIIQIKDIRAVRVETIHELSLRVRHEPPDRKQRREMLISKMIGRFKMQSSKQINLVNPVIYFNWQPRFYDHIVRTDDDIFRIREYIKNNPKNWDCDRNNK